MVAVGKFSVPRVWLSRRGRSHPIGRLVVATLKEAKDRNPVSVMVSRGEARGRKDGINSSSIQVHQFSRATAGEN